MGGFLLASSNKPILWNPKQGVQGGWVVESSRVPFAPKPQGPSNPPAV